MTTRHYWRARLVARGPFVGVCTWFGPPWIAGEELDRSWRHQALVRNETTARAILEGGHVPVTVDDIFLRNVEPITKDEWEYLVSHSEWAVAHAPQSPDATPTEKIDVRGRSIF